MPEAKYTLQSITDARSNSEGHLVANATFGDGFRCRFIIQAGVLTKFCLEQLKPSPWGKKSTPEKPVFCAPSGRTLAAGRVAAIMAAWRPHYEAARAAFLEDERLNKERQQAAEAEHLRVHSMTSAAAEMQAALEPFAALWGDGSMFSEHALEEGNNEWITGAQIKAAFEAYQKSLPPDQRKPARQ